MSSVLNFDCFSVILSFLSNNDKVKCTYICKMCHAIIKIQLAKYYTFFSKYEKNYSNVVIYGDIDIAKCISIEKIDARAIACAIINGKLEMAQYFYSIICQKDIDRYFPNYGFIKSNTIEACEKNFTDVVKWILPLINFNHGNQETFDTINSLLSNSMKNNNMELYMWLYDYFAVHKFNISILHRSYNAAQIRY